MIRIVVSGLCTKEICRLVSELGKERVAVHEAIDITGATEVAQGQADYYFGACATGAGGALAMAIAILGYDRCFTASMVGSPPKEVAIMAAVAGGKRAFGFTVDHIDSTVSMLLSAILAHHREPGNDD
jgi:hypothetical protein